MKIKLFKVRLAEEFVQADQDMVNNFLEGKTIRRTSTELIESPPKYWSLILFYEEAIEKIIRAKKQLNDSGKYSQFIKESVISMKDFKDNNDLNIFSNTAVGNADQCSIDDFKNSHLISGRADTSVQMENSDPGNSKQRIKNDSIDSIVISKKNANHSINQEMKNPKIAPAESRPDEEDFPLTPIEQSRLDKLKLWRNETASRLNLPGFMVTSNAALTNVAKNNPSSLEALLAVRGFGPNKVEKFGNEIIALLNCIVSLHAIIYNWIEKKK